MSIKMRARHVPGFVLLGVMALSAAWLLSKPSAAPGSRHVRGFLLAELGDVGTGTAHSRIALPGVPVFLKNARNSKASEVNQVNATDSNGRFALNVPSAGEYQICWTSKIYGDGCAAEVFSAGEGALYLGKVPVAISSPAGTFAAYGNVRMRDGSKPNTYLPYADINARADVTLHDASGKQLLAAAVNQQGQYLLPNIPKGQVVELRAHLEHGEGRQLIHPDAYVHGESALQYHLQIANHRPMVEPLLANDAASGRRMQIAVPGARILLQAKSRDADGDALQTRWLIAAGDGTLSASAGAQVEWTVPQTPGRYSVSAVVADGKGGYDHRTLKLAVGSAGVPFSGTVLEAGGVPLANAEVDINAQRSTTDAQGRFQLRVKEAERYVLNIRSPGHGLQSQVYADGISGGRWTLTRSSVSTFAADKEIVFQDTRRAEDCPGPASAQIAWTRESKQVWWQDGRGNTLPAASTLAANSMPAARDDSVSKVCRAAPATTALKEILSAATPAAAQNSRLEIAGRDQALLPWLALPKQQACGPGVRVRIPANALQRADGSPPQGMLELSLASVDPNTPGQAQGDATLPNGRGIRLSHSLGGASVEIREVATGQALQIRPGKVAELGIPVDAANLSRGAKLPGQVALRHYDEANGRWQTATTMQLAANRQFYSGRVAHFSTYNTQLDIAKPACLRVHGKLAPPYDLEVISPMPDGLAPRVSRFSLTDTASHALYPLPANTRVTVVAMRPASGSRPPTALGVYIVNTAAPMRADSALPPAPETCSSELILKEVQLAVGAGDFLTGVHGIAASALNEDEVLNGFSGVDLAQDTNGIPLSTRLDLATYRYYAQIDPPLPNKPDGLRLTLDDFLVTNGFIDGYNDNRLVGFQKCKGKVCDDPDQEINVVYANSGDLGFGRDMHCRRKNTGPGTGYDYACYVTNYGDIDTDDERDASDARDNADPIATVAMEYSRIRPGDALTDRHVKFYVYNAAGFRVNNADLDSAQNTLRRPIPQLCMTCHGGVYTGALKDGVPAFDTPESVKLGSRFLPFDLRFYTFPREPDKAAQQAAFKRLNQDIVRPASPDAAIAEIIDGMYEGDAAVQKQEFVIPGWKKEQLPNTAVQEEFYQRVIGNTCRSCHAAQPFANGNKERIGVDLQFRTAYGFIREQKITGGGVMSALSVAEQRVCAEHLMPHARRTHDIFWGSYWRSAFGDPNPSIAGQFQAFGEELQAAPRPAAWPEEERWPPLWDGRLCGVYDKKITPPSYYSSYIHPLWTRNYRVGLGGAFTCTNCHANLSGDATETHAALLRDKGLFDGPRNVIPYDSRNSNLVKKLKGQNGARMPLGCAEGNKRCMQEAGVYNRDRDSDPQAATTELDRISHWINSGAAP